VSGAFLKSSFFLPIGTEMLVRFQVEPTGPAVEARVEVLRQETEGDRTGRTGMGLRFLEFFRQTEVALARLFLGEQLRKFAEGYLGSPRARSLTSELDRVVDALAAWELMKVTSPDDPWRFAEVVPGARRHQMGECFLKLSSSLDLGPAPRIWSTTLPPLKTRSIGMLRMP
jgi:hypothetical protein